MQSYSIGVFDAYFDQVSKESSVMFIFYILTSGYNWFVDLLIGNNKSVEDKEYTTKDVTLKMIMLGIVLFLSILILLNMQSVVLILMSMSK